ncbi:MAG: dihydrodipicolinate synthase family protein [Thermomicrobiales bacterium]
MSVRQRREQWSGVFPATLVPFLDDPAYSLDEVGLRAYIRQFVGIPGIKGVVCNGHTGEIQALFPEQRRRVVEVLVDELGDALPVISGIAAEATLEAVQHAQHAQAAGAKAILLMPPHLWLRFGRESATALRFVRDVAASIDIGVIIHQYPAWTKVSYTSEELVELAQIPNVVAIKDGTRDIARYERNIRMLRDAAPDVAILTCHDEYLLPTLVQGIDGALIGFAGFVPELMAQLVAAALGDNLAEARRLTEQVFVLKQAVYRMGEPSADAHQRMKMAVHLLGRISSPRVRPPLAPLTDDVVAGLRRDLERVGLHPAEPALR